MIAKLRMGMIGGGIGAFIGGVHRMAASMDGLIECVAGSFSADPNKSRETGEALGLDPGRIYSTYQEMIEKEAALPEDKRIDIVSIVTPNHLHFAPAVMALQKGFHVVLEKPMTFDLEEARKLHALVAASNQKLMLCHTYNGYPMVKQARQLVKEGALGNLRKIYVEYPQGWLSTLLEASQHKQASWRTDPGKSGKAGAMGDIGTHAFNLAEYISGLTVSHVCADINTVVPGRLLDDDGAVLLRFENGVSGVLTATQIAAGEENNLRIRVFGDQGGLEWQQKDNNSLSLFSLDKVTQVYRTGGPANAPIVQHNTRLPAGHPEGYLEAFANLYRNFALAIQKQKAGQSPKENVMDYPGTLEGLRGMAFIETVVASGLSQQKWTAFKM
jgi:predicted dehydrogenase